MRKKPYDPIRKLEPFVIVTKKWLEAIKLAYSKSVESLEHRNLGPTKNAEEVGPYIESLEKVLLNDNIKNIAVTGSYGSGKSSVLLTFFDDIKYSFYNPVSISLAAFNQSKLRDNTQATYNEFNQSLEKSVLQQLLYHVDEKKVPLSSFKRLSKVSKISILMKSMLLCLSLFIIAVFFYPGVLDFYQSRVNQIVEVLQLQSFQVIISTVIALVIFCSILWLVFQFYYLVIAKYNISKVKIKDAEIEINGKNESLFNRFIDEILYFFEVTNHRVVIFEDLDRFTDSYIIFSKLRELNILINNSSQIKRKIVFIYAVKDDYFKNTEERTKFFDYILPIIPTVSDSSSNEVIWRRLELMNDSFGKKLNIRKEYINDISKYLSDRRAIDNLLNEFYVMRKKFEKIKLNDEKLFSMIAYKNKFPQRYVLLQEKTGSLSKYIDNKEDLVSLKILNLNGDINKLRERRKKVINERLNNSSELKMSLLYNIYSLSRNYPLRYFTMGSETVDSLNFLNKDFDYNKINQITSITTNAGNSDIKSVFENFGGVNVFSERLASIDRDKDIHIEEIDNMILDLKNEINSIKIMTIKEILESDIEIKADNDINPFEFYLLRRGYISEDYIRYCSIFIEGDLSEIDFNFAINVSERKKSPYELELKNAELILKEHLNPRDLLEPFYLNYVLIDYIISDIDTKQQEINSLFEMMNKYPEEVYQFVDGFITVTNQKQSFVSRLFNNSPNVVEYIFSTYKGNEGALLKWVILYLKYVEKTGDITSKNKIIQYLNDLQDGSKLLEEINSEDLINVLKELKVRFTRITFDNNDFLKTVFENELIIANENMIKKIFVLYELETDQFANKCLSIVYDSKIEILVNFIVSHFSDFLDKCYSKNTNDLENEEIIKTVLHDSRINNTDKKKLLQCIAIQLTNIDMLPVSLLETAVKENIVAASWNDIIMMFRLFKDGDLIIETYESFEHLIGDFYNNNTNYLLSSKIDVIDDSTFIKLLFNEHITNKSIMETREMYTQTITDITNTEEGSSEPSEERLELLIDLQLLDLNEVNFNYFVTHELYTLAAKLLLDDRFNLQDWKKYELNTQLVDEIIGQDEYPLNRRLEILELVDLELFTDESIKFIRNSLPIELIYKYHGTVIEAVMFGTSDEAKIITGLSVLLENKIDIRGILGNLESGLSKIGNISQKTVSLGFNDLNVRFAKLLQERRLISSSTVRKDKIILNNFRK